MKILGRTFNFLYVLQVFERTLTTGSIARFLWCLPIHYIVIGRVCALCVGRYGIRFPAGEGSLSILLSVQMGSGASQWVPADLSRGDITAGTCN
jgi:hypothetical protein